MAYISVPPLVRSVVIDPGTVLSATTGYTSPTFLAEAFQEITILVEGLETSAAFDPVLNLIGPAAPTAGAANLTYTSSGAQAIFDSAASMYAAILDSAGGNISVRGKITVYPLITGRVRHYFSEWHSSGVVRRCTGSGQCTNTATGITAVGWTGSTSFTGTVKVFGLTA